MALIDITELLDDDDFCDAFFLRRKVQSIGSNGLAHDVDTSTLQAGVCFPGSGNKLVRTPDGERVEADMSIVTKCILHDGRSDAPADMVEYLGQAYTVFYVEDFANWGGGFIQAHCMLASVRG